MSPTCPEGHRSEATDYCDVCGTPMDAPPAGMSGADGSPGAVGGGAEPARADAAVARPEPDPAATLTCPFCGGANVPDALFCEECGYDFTTGAAPFGAEPVGAESEADEVSPAGEEHAAQTPAAAEDDPPEASPEQDAAPASALDLEETPHPAHDREQPRAPDLEEAPASDLDLTVTPDPEPEEKRAPERDAQPAEPDPEAEPQPAEPDPEAEPQPAEPDPEQEPAGAPPSEPQPAQAHPVAHARPRHTPPSRRLADTWVVEIWVDPDWYDVQETTEPCPSAGVPDVVTVQRNVVLIGRPSGSRGVRPDVDAGLDSAVSRQHAQLTSDGHRWWIEDLGSSNGTFVGVVGEELPDTPLTAGQRLEIDRDDRIYVGAWTRLVIRQATPAERAGQG